MIDVHAPHDPATSFRGFLIHLLTITIGLLIALGLEGIVEWHHHVHLRREATMNLKEEIRGNRSELARVMAALPEETKECQGILEVLQSKHPRGLRVPSPMGLKIGNPEEAGWQTASATGVLEYMDYGAVQRFAGAYQLQNKLDAQQDRAMSLVWSLDSSLRGALQQETPREAIAATQGLLTQLQLLRDLGSELDQRYAVVLNQQKD